MHPLKTAPFRHEITPFIQAWHCAPRQNMAVIPGFPISALFRIPSGTVPTARLHQTPIPTILQINGKTSRGDPAACGMEVRLIPRRPSTASRQCPHLGDAGLWRACRPHPWSQWSARPILRQTPATYEHIFRKRLFSACHPLHSDTDIQWIAQRPSSPQFDRLYHYPSKAWSFGTLITGRVLRHFPPECRRQLPSPVYAPKRPFAERSKTHSDGPSRIHQVLHVAFGTTFKNSQDHTHPTTNRFRDMAT